MPGIVWSGFLPSLPSLERTSRLGDCEYGRSCKWPNPDLLWPDTGGLTLPHHLGVGAEPCAKRLLVEHAAATAERGTAACQ